LQGFADNMMKVTAFGTIAVMVISLVVGGFHRPPEKISGLFNLVPDAWQVHQPERGAVFIDEVLQRNAVESEITILQVESFLRKIVRLFDEIKVCILHFPKPT
jgi:hypothetical protein